MSAERMSVRALAAMLGISPTTVMSDIKSADGYAPNEDGMIEVGKVMGIDGKVRPSRRIDTSRRDTLIRELFTAGHSMRSIALQVGCSVGTVHRTIAGDR
jgi:IS30 family transposase